MVRPQKNFKDRIYLEVMELLCSRNIKSWLYREKLLERLTEDVVTRSGYIVAIEMFKLWLFLE